MSIPGSVTPLFNTGGGGGVGITTTIERSLRFNSADSAYLSRAVPTAGNRRTWTWAGWVKRSVLGTRQQLFSAPSNSTYIEWQNDALQIEEYSGSPVFKLALTAVQRDTSAWYHILVAFDTTQATPSNRIKIYINGVEQAAFSTASYPSPNHDSGINGAALHKIGAFPGSGDGGNFYYLNGYLADIHFIDGQALDATAFTQVSATTGQLVPKAYTGSFGTNGFWLQFADNSNNTATTLGKDTSGNSNNWTPNNFSVTGLVDHTPAGLSYRDSSTTNRNWDQSTASSTTSAAIGPDRIYWIDLGSSKSFNRVTFSVVASGQSSDTSTNFITYFSTSSSSTGSSICGSGCTVTKSGSPSGTTPGTITVTFAGFASQNGRYIGIASGSGAQGGTYTYSNFKVYDDQGAANDSLVDTPTSYGTDTGVGGEVRGNYATLNPLQKGSDLTLSNGNLDLSKSSTVDKSTASTIGMTSGKWYFELAITNLGGGEYAIGFGRNIPIESYVGSNATTWSYADTGLLMHNANTTSYGSSYTTGDVLGAAFDGDNGTLVFYKNGVSQGTAATGLTQGPYFFTAGVYQSTATRSANFGQRAFAYTAPSGFKALCDTNLISTTITTSGSYTGNGVADGPFVYLNGVPTAMTIGGNAVTFGTHADKLSNGFKIRTSSTTYNQNASSYSYSITSTGAAFKNARAQPNP